MVSNLEVEEDKIRLLGFTTLPYHPWYTTRDVHNSAMLGPSHLTVSLKVTGSFTIQAKKSVMTNLSYEAKMPVRGRKSVRTWERLHELRALTKALASVPCCEGRTAMAQPPAPHPDEQGRLDVLLALDVLDTTPEAHFEGLVKLGKYARVIAEHEI